jgi:hypothetical protein
VTDKAAGLCYRHYGRGADLSASGLGADEITVVNIPALTGGGGGGNKTVRNGTDIL